MDILIVDDDKGIGHALSELIELYECKPTYVSSAEDAETVCNFTKFDMAIIDYNLQNGVTGLGLMVKLRKKNPNLHVIIITCAPSIELAVDSIKQGAFNFIPKPFDIAKLERCIDLVRAQLQKDFLNQCNEAFRENGLLNGKISAKGIKECKPDANCETCIEPCDANANLYELERQAIMKAIFESDTLQEAANRLGIDKVTLYRKRLRMGLIKKAG